MADGIGTTVGGPVVLATGPSQGASRDQAVAEAILSFEAMMVQSLVASGFAQNSLLRSLPTNDVGGAMQRLRAEEEERLRELEEQREEDEAEAERG